MDFKSRFEGKTSHISKEGVESALFVLKDSAKMRDLTEN